MTMIFDGLYAEAYRVAIGLPLAKRECRLQRIPR